MLINGQPADAISALDRGLLYGDGVFETLRIHRGKPVLWPQHLARLQKSCSHFGLNLDINALETELQALLATNDPQGIVKLIVTRGIGGRGYGAVPEPLPTRILQFFPLPEAVNDSPSQGVDVMLCQQRAGHSSLAPHKHLNRLEQVMAAREITGQFAEGIMLNLKDQVIEGTRSNIFLVSQNNIATPLLERCGVAGVMRGWLLDQFISQGTPVQIRDVGLNELLAADEVFLCNSVFGIWPVISLHSPAGQRDFIPGATTKVAQDLFQRALQESC